VKKSIPVTITQVTRTVAAQRQRLAERSTTEFMAGDIVLICKINPLKLCFSASNRVKHNEIFNPSWIYVLSNQRSQKVAVTASKIGQATHDAHFFRSTKHQDGADEVTAHAHRWLQFNLAFRLRAMKAFCRAAAHFLWQTAISI
jgi:hypothetical protein